MPLITSLLMTWRNMTAHKKVLTLAFPMILSNLSTPLVTLVDTMVIGHQLKTYDMAAVALGGSFYSLIIGCLGFLRMGTTGFTAQAFGQKQGNILRQILLQCMLLTAGLSLVSCLLAITLCLIVLAWINPSIELSQAVQHFFYIRLIGLPAALINYTLVGWFLGIQNVRAPLAMMIITNIINLILSIWFILHLQLGVAGAAQAAILGEWCGTLLGLILLYQPLKRYTGIWSFSFLTQWQHWAKLITVNRDIFIRSLTLQLVFMLVTLQGTRLGEQVVAANMLIINGLIITSYILDGFAHAIEALCGQAIGAKDKAQLQQTLIIASGWGLLISLGFAISFGLFGDYFINLQTSIEVVRLQAYPLIPYLALLPLIAVWSYLLDGLFIGATRAREMRNSMLFAFLISLPLAIVLQPLANNGLWFSLLSFMALRGSFLAYFSWQIAKKQQWIS